MKGFMAVAALAAGLAHAPATRADDHYYRLTVDGLTGPFRGYGLERKLGAIDGVRRVDIDLDRGIVRVTMAAGAILREAAARDAVRRAGFTMRGFEPPAYR